MEKKARKVTTKFYVLNVKLRSNERSGTDAYLDIFQDIYRHKTMGNLRGVRSVILRTQFKTEVEGEKILYGKIGRFTKLESDEWLNVQNLEKEHVELPAGLFPNLNETDYYWIPQAHRFIIRKKSGGPTVSNAVSFLNDAIKKHISATEQFEVAVETSRDEVEKIFNSQVRRLEIEISYTNQDTNEETAKFIDDQLKTGNVGKYKMIVTPDQNENLSFDSKILKGALELAKSNGKAIASIRDGEKKSYRTVKTSDHPEEFVVVSPNQDLVLFGIFRKIMDRFRP